MCIGTLTFACITSTRVSLVSMRSILVSMRSILVSMRSTLVSMRVSVLFIGARSGGRESICFRRANHELQCIWDVVFKGIIEGLGHIVIDRLVESWGKVLHSIGYSTDEAYQDRCLTHSTVLTIYQRCILDSTSQVFLIGPLIGW